MTGNAALTVIFLRALEYGSDVYVETLTSSVVGLVQAVHTDGVEILREGDLLTVISFDKIQIAEERPCRRMGPASVRR